MCFKASYIYQRLEIFENIHGAGPDVLPVGDSVRNSDSEAGGLPEVLKEKNHPPAIPTPAIYSQYGQRDGRH